MATKFQRKQRARAELQRKIDDLLGKKTEFEIALKGIEAVFDYANGIRQAANIQNAALSQKAQNGLAYIQGIDALIQTIKTYKQEMDTEFDAIDASQEEVQPPVLNGPPVITPETEI